MVSQCIYHVASCIILASCFIPGKAHMCENIPKMQLAHAPYFGNALPLRPLLCRHLPDVGIPQPSLQER
jgi:hypothetical protein